MWAKISGEIFPPLDFYQPSFDFADKMLSPSPL